jgi:hypothetical protein
MLLVFESTCHAGIKNSFPPDFKNKTTSVAINRTCINLIKIKLENKDK